MGYICWYGLHMSQMRTDDGRDSVSLAHLRCACCLLLQLLQRTVHKYARQGQSLEHGCPLKMNSK